MVAGPFLILPGVVQYKGAADAARVGIGTGGQMQNPDAGKKVAAGKLLVAHL
jgi:hypothetical protein